MYEQAATNRLVWVYEQAPALLAVMREQVTPSIVYGFGETVSGGGDKARMPLRADVLDQLTELWDGLQGVVDEISVRITTDTLTGPVDEQPGAAGIVAPKATATPADWTAAGTRLVNWVKLRRLNIDHLELADPADYLAELVSRHRASYLPREKPHWWHTKRLCETCQTRSVGVTWEDKRLLVACTNCGAEIVGPRDPMRSYWEQTYLDAAVAAQTEENKRREVA